MNRDWSLLNISDVTTIVNGGTPKTNIKEYWDGDIAWITPSDLGKLKNIIVDKTIRTISEEGLQKSSAKLFPKNSVILSTRAPIGHLAINSTPMSTNQGCRGIVPSEKLDTFYLYYFLKNNVTLLNSLGTGTTFKELSTKALGAVKIPIPPIEEQKQIVEILDKAFESIEQAKVNIEKNIENTKELFQSRLNEIFSQKGEGWEEKTLGEVCEMIKRGISPKYTETDGLIVINQKCIRNHKIDLSLSRLHNSTLKSVNNERIIKIGDVLINSTGTGTLGRIAQVRDIELVGCTVDSHVTIVRPSNDLFYLDFFGYALIKIEKEIENSGEGTSGQTELSRIKLQNDFIINYPSNLKKQQEIVLILDSLKTNLKNMENYYKQKLKNLEELKKSILQKAFSGELLK